MANKALHDANSMPANFAVFPNGRLVVFVIAGFLLIFWFVAIAIIPSAQIEQRLFNESASYTAFKDSSLCGRKFDLRPIFLAKRDLLALMFLKKNILTNPNLKQLQGETFVHQFIFPPDQCLKEMESNRMSKQ